MKVYSCFAKGNDGAIYGVRYLLEEEELAALQKAGIIGPVNEIIGMQDEADSVIGQLQKTFHTHFGGAIQ